MSNEHLPTTLLEAVRYFSDPDTCLQFMVNLRWPDGVVCSRCGSREVTFLANARVWKCRVKHNSQKFSIKVGTVMEDSPIALEQWLPAIWLITNAKNGISSYEIHRALGVTQKTAWFLLHRIRLAMQNGSFETMSGTIEADETYIGGLARNMHKDKKERVIKGTGGSGKTIVMGLLERHGMDKSQKVIDTLDSNPKKDKKVSRVKTKVIPNTTREILQGEVKQHVEAGSEVFTDALASYNGLDPKYVHQVIDHAETYVRGNVHTNGIENFWSLLKRAIKGTYVSVEPFHLFRYLDEQSFRFNERKQTDSERFMGVVSALTDKRLTYQALTGKSHPTDPEQN